MGCDLSNPHLFTLYNGPCITADNSAEARDQYATRHSWQYHPNEILKAEHLARLTEEDVNSHYGAVVNAMRTHHGDNKVVSLNDRPPKTIHIQIEIQSRKAKDPMMEIRDEQNPIQQRKVSRNGKTKQFDDLTVDSQNHDLFDELNHRSLYPFEVIDPNRQSDSETSQYGNQD